MPGRIIPIACDKPCGITSHVFALALRQMANAAHAISRGNVGGLLRRIPNVHASGRARVAHNIPSGAGNRSVTTASAMREQCSKENRGEPAASRTRDDFTTRYRPLTPLDGDLGPVTRCLCNHLYYRSPNDCESNPA